jgi:soluble lytic murein transglycosylase-like protein
VIRMLWNTLPTLLLVQAFGWVLMVLVPVLVVHGSVDQQIRSVAFAVPAAADAGEPWRETVDEFASRVSQAFGVRGSDASEFAGWILEASERQGLDPELLASLVHTESTFRKHARSHKGAVGPAQVKPKIWSEFCGTSNLLDPAENIYCGAQVLSFLRDECGDDLCALQAYNTGKPGAGLSAARRYVAKIDRARDRLRNIEL